MMWRALDPRANLDQLGFIPNFLEENDPRPAAVQINDRYGFGGGWQPMPRFEMNIKTGVLRYPGDPALYPLFISKLRDEVIRVYPHAWVSILQPDGSYEVARMD